MPQITLVPNIESCRMITKQVVAGPSSMALLRVVAQLFEGQGNEATVTFGLDCGGRFKVWIYSVDLGAPTGKVWTLKGFIKHRKFGAGYPITISGYDTHSRDGFLSDPLNPDDVCGVE